jgi:hypothetical protein
MRLSGRAGKIRFVIADQRKKRIALASSASAAVGPG